MSLRKREKELAPELNEDNKNGDDRGEEEEEKQTTSNKKNKKLKRSKTGSNKKIVANDNTSDNEIVDDDNNDDDNDNDDDDDDKKSNKSSKSNKRSASVTTTGGNHDDKDLESNASDHEKEKITKKRDTGKNVKNKSGNNKKADKNKPVSDEEEVEEEEIEEGGNKLEKNQSILSINYENSDCDGDNDDEPIVKRVKSNAKNKNKSKSTVKSGKNAKIDEPEEKSAVDNGDEEEEEEEDYEVEKIVNHKYQKGKLFYEIRWKGYEDSDNTWEPESTLSCPELIKKYREINPDIEKSPSSKKRNNEKRGESKTKPTKRQKKTDNEEEETWDENKNWEVKSIQDVYFKRDGTRKFLIRWVGYSANDDTWEPEEHLQCEELIKRYMEKVDDSKNANQKELRMVRKHTERFTLMDEQRNRRISKRGNGRQRVSYFDAE